VQRRRGRYGNVKRYVAADGTKLDSGREYKRYQDLLLLERAGEISKLEVHPRYKIVIGGVPVMMKSTRYPNGRHLTYVADFTYLLVSGVGADKEAERVIEDVKMQSGHRTEVYKIKRALMDAMGLTITEY